MASPEFRTLDEVEYGSVSQLTPLIRRIVAENPSKFTYKGTGTYIVGHGDVVVIDPGPLLDTHRGALAAALEGERVRAILVTHCHSDHSPLAAWLRDETGAPTIAYGPHPRPDPGTEPVDPAGDDTGIDDTGIDDTEIDDTGIDDTRIDDTRIDNTEIEESTDYDFVPDVTAVGGDVVVDAGGLTMTAVHTPGHTSNHTCWSLAEEGALFTGDHVMGWSTTVVSPPDGDMAAYVDSLRKVADRNDAMLWPTHGPPRDDGRRYVTALIEHREARETGVLEAVLAGRSTIPEIVALLYADVREELHKPAGRSVWAHLDKLVAEGRVATEGAPTLDGTYFPV